MCASLVGPSLVSRGGSVGRWRRDWRTHVFYYLGPTRAPLLRPRPLPGGVRTGERRRIRRDGLNPRHARPSEARPRPQRAAHLPYGPREAGNDVFGAPCGKCIIRARARIMRPYRAPLILGKYPCQISNNLLLTKPNDPPLRWPSVRRLADRCQGHAARSGARRMAEHLQQVHTARCVMISAPSSSAST